MTSTRPVIGLAAIHREYFVAADGQEIISLRTLEKMSKEMQDCGAVARVVVQTRGRRKVRLVALEPFFSLWRRNKLCGHHKKDEIEGFMWGTPKG